MLVVNIVELLLKGPGCLWCLFFWVMFWAGDICVFSESNASGRWSDHTAVAVQAAIAQCVWQVIGGSVSEELIRELLPSTSVAGVWRELKWVTLVTFAALTQPSGQDRRTIS